MLGIGVEQSPNHALVLGVMFTGFPLKVLDASLAQCESHFDSFVPKNKFLGTREEIRNDSKVSEGFVGVFYFLAHRFACLSASNRPRISELHHHET
jgi:hypothetical protein